MGSDVLLEDQHVPSHQVRLWAVVVTHMGSDVLLEDQHVPSHQVRLWAVVVTHMGSDVLLEDQHVPSHQVRLWGPGQTDVPRVQYFKASSRKYGVCLFITGRMPRSGKLPVLNLFPDQKSAFSPRRGDLLHRFKWNLAWLRDSIKFRGNRCTGWERGPQSWKFPHFVSNLQSGCRVQAGSMTSGVYKRCWASKAIRLSRDPSITSHLNNPNSRPGCSVTNAKRVLATPVLGNWKKPPPRHHITWIRHFLTT